MALAEIAPMHYSRFVREVRPVLRRILEVPDLVSRGSWADIARRYDFRGAGLEAGSRVRLEFNEMLRNADAGQERADVANEILRWGGMDDLDQHMVSSLETSLEALEHVEAPNIQDIYVQRISSVTKIYEMWDPNSWVIYDSYCAIGLQWLIRQAWNEIGSEECSEYLRLPFPSGRSNTSQAGFPTLNSLPQSQLAFVYASWLCREIAKLVNERSDTDFHWRAYHVEMAAFQLGHEV